MANRIHTVDVLFASLVAFAVVVTVAAALVL